MRGWGAAVRITAVALGIAALAGGCECLSDLRSSLGSSWDGGRGLSYRPEPPAPTATAREQLVPAGKLRVALQLSN
jgi:hypothetical protein